MINYAIYLNSNYNVKIVELKKIQNHYTFKYAILEDYFLLSVHINGARAGVDSVSNEINSNEHHFFQHTVLNDNQHMYEKEIDQNYFYPSGHVLYLKTRYNLTPEQCAINLLNKDVSKILKQINTKTIPEYNQIKHITIIDYSVDVLNVFKNHPYIGFTIPIDFDKVNNPNIFIDFYINGFKVLSQELNSSLNVPIDVNTFFIFGIRIQITNPDFDLSKLSKCLIIPSHYIFITDDRELFTIINPTHLEDLSGPFSVDFKDNNNIY